MAFAGLANVSPSNDAVCFLWELKSEAQTLSLTLSPTPFLLALLGATKALLFPSSLHPGASCRHLLAFLLLGALADSSLWSAHPAPSPHHRGRALGRRVRLHFSKRVLFIFQQSGKEPKLSRVTVFSPPTGICEIHLQKVCLSLFQTLIPMCFEFGSYSVIKHLWNWDEGKHFFPCDFCLFVVFGFGWGEGGFKNVT